MDSGAEIPVLLRVCLEDVWNRFLVTTSNRHGKQLHSHFSTAFDCKKADHMVKLLV